MILYLTALIILGLPALYGIKMIIREKRKKKKQIALGLAYDRLMREAKLSIENIEQLNGKVIGLDRKNKKLLLIDHNTTEKQEQCVPLFEIASCSIHKVKDDVERSIRKIYLELKHKRTNKISRFCFYDETCDRITELPSLARRAMFWKNRIDLHKYPGKINLEFEYML